MLDFWWIKWKTQRAQANRGIFFIFFLFCSYRCWCWCCFSDDPYRDFTLSPLQHCLQVTLFIIIIIINIGMLHSHGFEPGRLCVCVCGEGLIFCSGPPRPHPRCGTRPCHRSLPRSRCVHAWSPRARLHRDTETVLEESIQTHTSNLITYNTLALPDWTFPRPNGGKYNHTNYFTAIILHTYIY